MARALKRKLVLSGLIVAAALVVGGVIVALQPSSQTASAHDYCNNRTFYPSSSYKECVKHIQNLLRVLPNYPDLAVDGYYGSRTTQAVKNFQYKEKITVDGVTGPQTWSRLCGPKYAKPDDAHRAAWRYRAWAAGCFS